MSRTISEGITRLGNTPFAKLRSQILRGGRMVKTTRGAASIAPMIVAGSVVLGAGGASAADECGPLVFAT